jgi:hypothetical protein
VGKMKKVILSIAIACGLGFAQVQTSKLKGLRIYLSRQDAGHQNGYDGFRKLMEDNKAVYGYEFEYSAAPLPQAQLDAVFKRLYKGDGQPKAANTIDILIFCQGEGDRNVAGDPFPGATDRMTMVNTHVKSGGGLISIHGAGGREASWQNWVFGARLMTDWFVDGYLADPLFAGNGGHFSAGTKATYTLDEETLPTKDSSTYFIRKMLTLPKLQKGYGQPLITDQVQSEWYHYNGGKKYENGTGGDMTHPNNKVQPLPVRGNMGVPDSGIGPAKIVGLITKIQYGTGYTPPGKGRHSVWVREVSKGKFDANASAINGRYVLFNPGHNGDEYTIAGGWMGDFFLTNLRWVAKDDRGCTDATRANYNAFATVNDGTCTPTSIGHDALLTDDESAMLGRISVANSGIDIAIGQAGAHALKVTKITGESVEQKSGNGIQNYHVPALKSGFYVVQVTVQGHAFKKLVSII